MRAPVRQSCLTLCDAMDCTPPGSSVLGMLQARILQWVAISPPGDLPNPGLEPGSPSLQADSLPTELQGSFIQTLNQDALSICDTPGTVFR